MNRRRSAVWSRAPSGIEFRKVAVRLAGRPVLEEISFSLPRGETLGLIGPNGAGKTTSFRLALGLLRPDEGRIMILGQDLRERRDQVIGRVGFVLDHPRMAPELTVRENLLYFAALYGLADRRRRVESVLERLDLRGVGGRPMRELSRGTAQRAAWARALLPEADLLLLDEPFHGLDPLWRERVRALLDRLHNEGKTIVVSSHDLEEIERICTRICLLDHGRVSAFGVPGSLFSGGSSLAEFVLARTARCTT